MTAAHKQLYLYVVLLICVNYSTLGYKLPNGGKIWAFLAAGSNGFYNYRHQADLCHAYQILHRNGIPDENIIVMMFDDIANSQDNPTPGVIINQPNGTDVYAGVPKDYTGTDVTPANFLKVLAGDEKGMNGIGTGRVIKSGPNDHIFVNFVDHGAPGLLGFPSEELYANDLEQALTNMSHTKQFAKMVIYVEACESGSMFDAMLPDYTNIFVTTAADPKEPSYACFYDDLRQTYLGDVFSVNWMADAEREVVLKETLHHQFEVVRTKTNTSHVEEYGDLDVGAMHVSDFIGFRMAADNKLTDNEIPDLPFDFGDFQDAVPSPHVPIAMIHRKLEATVNRKEREALNFELHAMLKKRSHLEQTMFNILSDVTKGDATKLDSLKNSRFSLTKSNFACYKNLATSFSSICFKFSDNPHALSQLYMLVNMCHEAYATEQQVIAAMNKVCLKTPVIRGIM